MVGTTVGTEAGALAEDGDNLAPETETPPPPPTPTREERAPEVVVPQSETSSVDCAPQARAAARTTAGPDGMADG